MAEKDWPDARIFHESIVGTVVKKVSVWSCSAVFYLKCLVDI